VDATAS